MKRREKTTRTKVKGDPFSRGPRYVRDEGWRFAGLFRVLLALIAVAAAALVFSVLHLGRFGILAGGACGEVEIPARSGAVEHRKTMGKLGQDAVPGSFSKVMLRDILGEYEETYQIPAGCGPGDSVAIYHFY
uniref:Uncharacterized protein n=1 Tax=Pyrodinium bahamense TaxID=73915 RepID=A0A7S0A1D2_9DINO|mmetsp:Transcript_1886/g.5160  ORF Transcript_1886/g.5160 Transcript_1886/m.5160 type:complete len:132 (+) Transcript_1886:97-492(+)|eukprot:CAMPEP_0179119108 /NCGR_PEP_ID=MMETSP0796-20121207/56055_1 /TAXON_ID=73915 /ORGANISM="Pyrodinium bahamense, Strain pbaha01" /LENGTH=131 /DNA_ID=CAMNT_0020817599 /DNA_START=36 /DNA_END=431 /DNA_ORIENTATION=+